MLLVLSGRASTKSNIIELSAVLTQRSRRKYLYLSFHSCKCVTVEYVLSVCRPLLNGAKKQFTETEIH